MVKGIIEIENMEFYAFHGCYREEQAVGNVFQVCFRMEVDAGTASRTDNVADTVSYLDVYEVIREQMEIPSHVLEHVARRILDAVAERFPGVLAARVKVSKMAPPLGGRVEKVSVSLDYIK